MTRVSLFYVASILVASFLTAPLARAADPHSWVSAIVVELGSVGKFTHKSQLAETTIKMLVDPNLPLWTWQNGKLIVPACNVTLGGSLKVEWTYGEKHDTSALHWTLGSLGGVSMPIKFDHPNDGIGANVLVDASRDKTWHITIPMTKGKTPQHLQAWTSKKGEKSPVKSILFIFECDEVPPPAKLKVSNAQVKALAQPKNDIPRLGPGVKLIAPSLEVRRLRLDLGLPDANALEWFKGQPTQKELLFHEVTGAAYERGGAQWGVTEAITVDGQTFQSRGIDSCSSAFSLKRYVVGARNNSTTKYGGTSTTDLQVSTSGPNGTFKATGKVGPVASNTESSSVVDVTQSGAVLFPSGTYAVKAELVAPAASSTPANNSVELNVVTKCRPLGAATWN